MSYASFGVARRFTRQVAAPSTGGGKKHGRFRQVGSWRGSEPAGYLGDPAAGVWPPEPRTMLRLAYRSAADQPDA